MEMGANWSVDGCGRGVDGGGRGVVDEGNNGIAPLEERGAVGVGLKHGAAIDAAALL